MSVRYRRCWFMIAVILLGWALHSSQAQGTEVSDPTPPSPPRPPRGQLRGGRARSFAPPLPPIPDTPTPPPLPPSPTPPPLPTGFPYLSCGQPAATCADSGVQLRAVSIERQEVAAPGNTALLVAFPSICFRLRLRPGAASAAAGSCAAAAVAGGLQELRLWTAGDASAAGVTATVRGVPVPVSSVPAPAGASDALGGYVLVVPLAAALSAADLAGGNATLCLRLPPPYVSAATGAAASIMGLLAREEAPLITEKRPDTWPRWDQTLSTEVRSVRLAYGLVAAGAACCPGPCTDAVVWYQSRCSRLISGEACAVVDRVAAAGNYAPFYRAVLAQTCLEAATSDCSFPLTGALLDSFAQLNPQGCVRCTDPGAAPAPNNPFPWCGPLGANIQPRLFYCVA